MYKLDHVQTNLRNELEDDIHDKKVHRSGEKMINDNFLKDKNKDNYHNHDTKKIYNRYYTVDGVKSDNKKYIINAEKNKNNTVWENIGALIDKIK